VVLAVSLVLLGLAVLLRVAALRNAGKGRAAAPGDHPLAQAVCDDCALPSGHLDAARLAILADMLEEAGATDPHLLGHLRSPGPHARGCFAVDCVLGKG
jgi:hypothetical protein